MKKIIMTLLAMLATASVSHAADLYCGANAEDVPGSYNYTKKIFWQKMDSQKNLSGFVMPDGTFFSTEVATAEQIAKIVDGTLNISISFQNGRPQLYAMKIKREGSTIKNEGLTAAISNNSNQIMLIAHGVSVICTEF
jgi:hypothetical protein